MSDKNILLHLENLTGDKTRIECPRCSAVPSQRATALLGTAELLPRGLPMSLKVNEFIVASGHCKFSLSMDTNSTTTIMWGSMKGFDIK